MKNNKFIKSEIFKISVLAAACVMSTIAYAESARDAVERNPLQGGRWLTKDEVNSGSFIQWFIKPRFVPKNIIEAKIPTCDRSKVGFDHPLSMNDCFGTVTYTKGVSFGTGHIPTGMMKVGPGTDNGDFVVTAAYVGDVGYYSLSEALIDEDEGSYSGCMVNKATLSRSASIAINTSNTAGSSSDSKEVYGSTTKVGASLGAEVGSTSTGEVSAPGGIAKVSTSVSVKVNSSISTEMANSHETSTNTGTSNTFTDGRLVTNGSILATDIPGGYIVSSAQYMPYMEIYGLFEMGRVLPPGVTKMAKDRLSDGTMAFRLGTSDSANGGTKRINEIGRPSSYWFGKLTVATNALKLPNVAAKALMVTSQYQKAMSLTQYSTICKADLGHNNIAPNMRFAINNATPTQKTMLCRSGHRPSCS